MENCDQFLSRFVANLSFCLPVMLWWYCIETIAYIVKLFPSSGRSITGFWSAIPLLQNSKGNSLIGGAKYNGVGKICDVRQKLPFISETIRDRSNCYYWSLIGSHKQPIDPFSVPITLSDLERRDTRGSKLYGRFPQLRANGLTIEWPNLERQHR